jgi:very-short-patch-repair endonuclease
LCRKEGKQGAVQSIDSFNGSGSSLPNARETVRSFRKNPTPSERILWDILRNRKLDGKRFHRQYRIDFEYQGRKRFFVADFYCPEEKLVIELDGKIHEHQAEQDEYRTFLINQLGMRVLRIKNEELLSITQVTDKIKACWSLLPG